MWPFWCVTRLLRLMRKQEHGWAKRRNIPLRNYMKDTAIDIDEQHGQTKRKKHTIAELHGKNPCIFPLNDMGAIPSTKSVTLFRCHCSIQFSGLSYKSAAMRTYEQTGLTPQVVGRGTIPIRHHRNVRCRLTLTAADVED
jgi:hypothetical protein